MFDLAHDKDKLIILFVVITLAIITGVLFYDLVDPERLNLLRVFREESDGMIQS